MLSFDSDSSSDVLWSWIEDNPVFADKHPSPVSITSESFHDDNDDDDVEAGSSIQLNSTSALEIQRQIQNSSPQTAKNVALRMYESMKRYGLGEEAMKALGGEEDVKREGGEMKVELGGGEKVSEELMGMEYLLKDGFVSYLRDVARITPPIPQQVVRFSGIRYTKTFEISDGGYATFGNKLVECFTGPLKSLFEKKNLQQLQILKGVDGYIMPGSMTLLLGPPGSGKSTLLEILAGRLQETNDSALDGVVHYNNENASEIRISRLIAYVNSQLNKHIPFLSVRETLEFAKDCTQGLQLENFTPQMRKFFAHALVEGQDPFLEYVLEILGLKQVEHKLASELSDIDRQKLTTAELALGTYSVMLYDQPLSGSDPAATYDLVDTIRSISRIQQSSAVMSLTQLSQEVFDLFDRVILLSDGRVLFQGPRQDAVTYFTNLGYMKPSHVESAEFLQDILAGYGSQYLTTGARSLSLDELVECYRVSDHYRDVMRIVEREDVILTYWIESEPGLCLSLKTPSKYHSSMNTEPRKETDLVVAKLSTKMGHSGGLESTGRVQVGDVVTGVSLNNENLLYLCVGSNKTQRERASHVYSMLRQAQGHTRLQVERYKEEEDEHQYKWENFKRPFVQTWWNSTKTLIKRQIKITKQLHALMKLRIFQAIVLGVFAGTLFYKLGGQYAHQEMSSVRALGFVSTMSIMLINLVQLPLYMIQRPIFYKHIAQKFFRASSYTVAHCVINLPQTFIEALAYTLCVYFLSGLSLEGNGTLFFYYLVLLFLVAYFGSSVFFFLSAISSIPEVGNALAGLAVSVFLLFSGFVIYPSKIPIYWKWLWQINPIHWANVSYCSLQFGKGYTDPCTSHTGTLSFCDQFPEMTVGEAYLAFNELSKHAKITWLPYAVLIGWTVIANLFALLGLKVIEFTGVSQSLPQQKKSLIFSNYKADIDSTIQSSQSYNGQSNGSSVSSNTRKQNSLSGHDRKEDDSGLSNWIEEFHIDLQRNGLGISVKPVTVLFLDFSFRRYNGETKKETSVFDSISGYAIPGTMLALMGGTKESKTTLLKCLSGRVPPDGILKGDLQANGLKMGTAFTRLVGYVEKVDAHQPYLSVRESLQFSAGLRLDQSINSMSRRIHVELVLDQLGLMLYANRLISSLHNATGETFEIAKKITIAVELAANPSVLVLEEPLSNLDTPGALSILRTLTQVSDSGRIVIVTISHPSARALSFFNQALILTREGNQGYFGPIGYNCNELLDYFTSIPKVPQYSQMESPVSFVMKVLGLGIKKRETPRVEFGEAYKQSSLHEINRKEISKIKRLQKHTNSTSIYSTYPMPYPHQAGLVLLRTQRFLWRNVQYTFGRLTGRVMIGLLMGSLYFQIEYKDVYGVTSRMLYIYMQVILVGVIAANNVVPQIGTDRLVYFREKRAGMYLPIFYPISWAIAEIPYFLIATLAMVGIGNGMAGIGTGSAAEFLKYWVALFMFTLCATYFGMMLTFLAPLPTLAAFSVSILTSMWVSASGIVVVFSDIKFYKWMYWSNPFQYVMNALTSISFYCDTKQCESECVCPKLPDGTYVWDMLTSLRDLSWERIDIDIVTLAGMCLLFGSLASLFFVLLKHNSPPHA